MSLSVAVGNSYYWYVYGCVGVGECDWTFVLGCLQSSLCLRQEIRYFRNSIQHSNKNNQSFSQKFVQNLSVNVPIKIFLVRPTRSYIIHQQ